MILGWKGEDTRTYVVLYKCFVHWDMTTGINQTQGGFHHRVARQLVGIHTQCKTKGHLEYTPQKESMSEAVLEEVKM